MRHGKFIVFYGVNRTGKSTQSKLLVDRLNSSGIKAEHIKYAIYNLEPSGPLINEYLRNKNPHDFSPREYQTFQVLNRQQSEPALLNKLKSNIAVVAEDYKGTGIAWGMADNVSQEFLERINSRLYPEDISFLFIGKQFSSGKETGHMHEGNNKLTKRAERMHLELAEKYGWIKINANRREKEISDEVFLYVKKLFKKPELNFYFGMSIIGDRSNLNVGKSIVEILKKYGTVLSEHVVRDDVFEFEAENIRSGVNIFERDLSWVEDSHYTIFEVTSPSTGIGREIQRSRELNTPALVLYRSDSKITKMVTHDRCLISRVYESEEQLEPIITDFIKTHKFWLD